MMYHSGIMGHTLCLLQNISCDQHMFNVQNLEVTLFYMEGTDKIEKLNTISTIDQHWGATYRFLKKSVLHPSRELGHGAGPASGVGHGTGPASGVGHGVAPGSGAGHGVAPGSGVGHGTGPASGARHGAGPHLAVRGDVKVICGGLSGIECHKSKPNVTMGLQTVEDHRPVGIILCNPQLKPSTTSLV